MSQSLIATASSTTPLVHAWTRWSRLGLAMVAGLAPAIVTLLLLAGHLKVDLRAFRPHSWNDQVYYWHQILTFKEAGLNGGYYSFYENTPQLEIFRFGASGPFYPAFYGTIARLTGWQPYTGILLNLAFITLAAWGFIWLARLDRRQIVLTGAVLLGVGPVLMFMPTNAQESFHQAAGVLLAGIFYSLLQRGGTLSLPSKLAIVLFLIGISLVRFSWLLLLPPCLLLMLRRRSWRRMLLILVAAGIIGVAVLLLFRMSSITSNNSVFKQMGSVSGFSLAGLSSLFQTALYNINHSFLTILNVHLLTTDTIQGLQFFMLLLPTLTMLLLPAKTRPDTPIHWGFYGYILVSLLVAALIFYLPGGYYRVFGPALLLVLLLLVAQRRYLPVIIVIFTSLITMGTFLNEYRQWRDNFIPHPGEAVLAAALADHLTYHPEAANPWCNTLLVTEYGLDYRITYVPAGIGVSFYSYADLQPLPVKSKYLFLTEAERQEMGDRLHVETLAVTPVGTLYRNLDALCPQ